MQNLLIKDWRSFHTKMERLFKNNNLHSFVYSEIEYNLVRAIQDEFTEGSVDLFRFRDPIYEAICYEKLKRK